MSMTFNQFVKELRDRGIKDQEAYMFTVIYDRLIETENQLTTAVKLIEQLVDSVQGFANLREMDQNALRQLIRGNRPDGVEVESVAYDPGKDD